MILQLFLLWIKFKIDSEPINYQYFYFDEVGWGLIIC